MGKDDKYIQAWIDDKFGHMSYDLLTYAKSIAEKREFNNDNRDYEMLNQLNTAIDMCLTVLYVYERDGNVSAGYMKEKLDRAIYNIKNTIEYFELKERTKKDE